MADVSGSKEGFWDKLLGRNKTPAISSPQPRDTTLLGEIASSTGFTDSDRNLIKSMNLDLNDPTDRETFNRLKAHSENPLTVVSSPAEENRLRQNANRDPQYSPSTSERKPWEPINKG